jgi:hypothetical protein
VAVRVIVSGVAPEPVVYVKLVTLLTVLLPVPPVASTPDSVRLVSPLAETGV